jgi:predicted translin family RNA/ssDNA-binding protein
MATVDLSIRRVRTEKVKKKDVSVMEKVKGYMKRLRSVILNFEFFSYLALIL